jgi:hypothetical protein
MPGNKFDAFGEFLLAPGSALAAGSQVRDDSN